MTRNAKTRARRGEKCGRRSRKQPAESHVVQRPNAAIRERERLKIFNESLEALQKVIPIRLPEGRKLHKKQTLQLACRYIKFLRDCLDGKRDWDDRRRFWCGTDEDHMIDAIDTAAAANGMESGAPKTSNPDRLTFKCTPKQRSSPRLDKERCRIECSEKTNNVIKTAGLTPTSSSVSTERATIHGDGFNIPWHLDMNNLQSGTLRNALAQDSDGFKVSLQTSDTHLDHKINVQLSACPTQTALPSFPYYTGNLCFDNQPGASGKGLPRITNSYSAPGAGNPILEKFQTPRRVPPIVLVAPPQGSGINPAEIDPPVDTTRDSAVPSTKYQASSGSDFMKMPLLGGSPSRCYGDDDFNAVWTDIDEIIRKNES
ncbi:uncharacterized protein LOC143460291 [Clavelina lepadiformis]|uniref:uncharacterized protein LOC143460291 n=1 Tax=Clavelina lepadiformis TaxID=159417 RepID=UPI0040416723